MRDNTPTLLANTNLSTTITNNVYNANNSSTKSLPQEDQQQPPPLPNLDKKPKRGNPSPTTSPSNTTEILDSGTSISDLPSQPSPLRSKDDVKFGSLEAIKEQLAQSGGGGGGSGNSGPQKRVVPPPPPPKVARRPLTVTTPTSTSTTTANIGLEQPLQQSQSQPPTPSQDLPTRPTLLPSPSLPKSKEEEEDHPTHLQRPSIAASTFSTSTAETTKTSGGVGRKASINFWRQNNHSQNSENASSPSSGGFPHFHNRAGSVGTVLMGAFHHIGQHRASSHDTSSTAPSTASSQQQPQQQQHQQQQKEKDASSTSTGSLATMFSNLASTFHHHTTSTTTQQQQQQDATSPHTSTQNVVVGLPTGSVQSLHEKSPATIESLQQLVIQMREDLGQLVFDHEAVHRALAEERGRRKAVEVDVANLKSQVSELEEKIRSLQQGRGSVVN
ncbi:hypothetical protein HDU97_005499 [Phlyctochytrium planicorne]|nr:hypothetical protein HDU97_005499 [Phlyctochytrium planicorne]